jgi:epoxide hydrolase
VRWTEYPHGGHYAALTVPEVWLNDVREFFRDLRQ